MKTWTVRAVQEVTYRVQETTDVFSPDNDALAAAAQFRPDAKRLVVIDAKVDELYGDVMRGYFRSRGVDAKVLAIAAEEPHKSSDSVFTIVRGADSLGISRRSDPIIAVGGGVLTDIVGLAANLYRRGTPFVRIPTTLVGLVDAAVGAKTAINFNKHKNRLGSYYPANHTLLDRTFLRTLPVRHIRNGLAEVIKIGAIKDAALFELVERGMDDLLGTNLTSPLWDAVIDRAVSGMLDELERNLWEHELCRVVDFGHTFSPRLEMLGEPTLLHGEAVAVDMAWSSALAFARDRLTAEELRRMLGVLAAAGLPLNHPYCTPSSLWAALDDTTKHRDGHQHLPIPAGLGNAVFVENLRFDELVRASEILEAFLRDGSFQ
jgi:2-epi-5-epi-valiolone synthase